MVKCWAFVKRFLEKFKSSCNEYKREKIHSQIHQLKFNFLIEEIKMFKVLFLIFVLASLGQCGEWKHWESTWSGIPSGAVRGGRDGGFVYYVIRAWYDGKQLPGKYSPDQNYGFVSYDKREIPVNSFDVSKEKSQNLHFKIKKDF